MRRILLPAVLTVTLMSLAGACGSSSSSSSSTTTAAPTSTTAPASTTSTTALPSHCASSELRAALGPADAGAGQIYQPIIVTNTGTRSCQLRGFPGVSLLDASSSQIGQPATRDGSEGATITLAPGASASAALHTTNGGQSADPCVGPSASIKVFPPDNTEALTVAAAFTACGGFSTSTLVAGTAGR